LQKDRINYNDQVLSEKRNFSIKNLQFLKIIIQISYLGVCLRVKTCSQGKNCSSQATNSAYLKAESDSYTDSIIPFNYN
jgi:hypothetical protein